jgi:hypothetical protein
VNHIHNGTRQTHKARPYIPKIYGVNELGGAQVMLMSGVDFDKLGLPDLREKSYVSTVDAISKSLYSYMILPAAVFGGLLYAAKRNQDHD